MELLPIKVNLGEEIRTESELVGTGYSRRSASERRTSRKHDTGERRRMGERNGKVAQATLREKER